MAQSDSPIKERGRTADPGVRPSEFTCSLKGQFLGVADTRVAGKLASPFNGVRGQVAASLQTLLSSSRVAAADGNGA
jgi:hypothetical protein